MDCCLWALRGVRAQFQKCVYNSTFLILSWYLCQTCGGVFKFDCCLWAKDTIARMCKQFNILDFILICVPNNWGSYWVRLLSLGPEGGGCTNSKMCVHFNIFLFYPDVVPKIWGSIQVGLLSVGPAGGRAQFLKCMYNSTFLILSLFLCQTFGGVIKSDCYHWTLLSPEGGRAQFLKMCVQFKILDSILIFVPKTQLSALENRQLGSNICPGPNCPGPNWAFH